MDADSLAGLIAHTLTDGGGTFAPRTLRPVTRGGYAVGCHRGTYRAIGLESPVGALVAAIVECARDYPNAHIGTWIEDGTVHVDPVRLYQSRTMALGYAWGAYQVAVYHLDTGATLYLTDTLGEFSWDAYTAIRLERIGRMFEEYILDGSSC